MTPRPDLGPTPPLGDSGRPKRTQDAYPAQSANRAADPGDSGRPKHTQHAYPAQRRLTRREALVGAGAALALAGCDPFGGGSGGSGSGAAASGSTLLSTWGDPVGDGQLRVLAGEPLLARTELGPPAPAGRVLATIAHVTDAHVMDASSPARVPFLDRLGPPFQSAFRPQETLTARVLDSALRAINALGADAVIQGGDLIDNDQANELAAALRVLTGSGGSSVTGGAGGSSGSSVTGGSGGSSGSSGAGGSRLVMPGFGPHGYYGVQSAANADPFYYRPDLDAPRHPGLLRLASRPFRAPGSRAPWYPVLGDHDILVQGEIVPSQLTQSLALGGRALWDLPRGLSLPPGLIVTSGGSPDGPLLPGIVSQLLQEALSGPTVSVPASPSRRELALGEVVTALDGAPGLRSATKTGTLSRPSPDRLDYAFDLGAELRVIVLDLARRAGGSGGLVVPEQPPWLSQQLAAAGTKWILVVSHQPLISSEGGDALMAILDQHPRVIAALAGHIHRNSITPRKTAAGGYWLITTASLIDYPQQTRALQVVALRDGGVALRTWMLDHVGHASLGPISRQLSYLDAQGGRPGTFAGARSDRNVTLYRRAP
jgi:3',5'-cyclic AMP phosphodiesterase CpdA